MSRTLLQQVQEALYPLGFVDLNGPQFTCEARGATVACTPRPDVYLSQCALLVSGLRALGFNVNGLGPPHPDLAVIVTGWGGAP